MPTLIFCALPNDTQPRYLANAASSAVTPISPAAKKFHLFILCSTFDNSPWSILSAPGFRVGGRQIADMNRQRPLYCRPPFICGLVRSAPMMASGMSAMCQKQTSQS